MYYYIYTQLNTRECTRTHVRMSSWWCSRIAHQCASSSWRRRCPPRSTRRTASPPAHRQHMALFPAPVESAPSSQAGDYSRDHNYLARIYKPARSPFPFKWHLLAPFPSNLLHTISICTLSLLPSLACAVLWFWAVNGANYLPLFLSNAPRWPSPGAGVIGPNENYFSTRERGTHRTHQKSILLIFKVCTIVAYNLLFLIACQMAGHWAHCAVALLNTLRVAYSLSFVCFTIRFCRAPKNMSYHTFRYPARRQKNITFIVL